jgi:hypothetical protein
MRMMPTMSREARCKPSGEKAMAITAWPALAGVRAGSSLPVATSQRRITPSAKFAATVLPSLEIAKGTSPGL